MNLRLTLFKPNLPILQLVDVVISKDIKTSFCDYTMEPD